MLRTRLPLNSPILLPDYPVRLACLNHAASVRSEPESNSPKIQTHHHNGQCATYTLLNFYSPPDINETRRMHNLVLWLLPLALLDRKASKDLSGSNLNPLTTSQQPADSRLPHSRFRRAGGDTNPSHPRVNSFLFFFQLFFNPPSSTPPQ